MKEMTGGRISEDDEGLEPLILTPPAEEPVEEPVKVPA